MDIIQFEYEVLIQKMKQNLPIKAFPTRELVIALKNNNPKVKIKSQYEIKEVINSGDISGILCNIDSGDKEEVLLCALTHLLIAPSEPLKIEIEKYQIKRMKRINWLNMQN
jgi:hypothetical protein